MAALFTGQMLFRLPNQQHQSTEGHSSTEYTIPYINHLQLKHKQHYKTLNTVNCISLTVAAVRTIASDRVLAGN